VAVKAHVVGWPSTDLMAVTVAWVVPGANGVHGANAQTRHPGTYWATLASSPTGALLAPC